MKTELVRVGNSRGIRIPKPLLQQCGFGDTVDLRLEDDHLVIAPSHSPRQGWEDAFRAAGASDDDELLLNALPASEFDVKEWRW